MKVFYISLMCIILIQLTPGAVSGETFDLNWGSTSAKSGLYANSTSIVRIVNQAYPHHIAATVIETKGFADNLKKLKSKSIHIGPAGVVEAYAAFRGKGEYTGSAIPGLRSLWGGYVTPIHIFAGRQSGITSIDQIDGSTFAMNPGTTSGKLVGMFFDALEIKPEYKSYSIALSKDAMRSGAVKCWYKAGYKDDAIVELENFMDITIFSVNKEMIEKMNAKYPGYGLSVTIPAGLYESVMQDQLSLAYVVSDFVHKDVPEEIVYKIVRAVWERRRQLTRSLSTLKHGRFEDLYDMAIDYGLSVPFHPGAAKFYQDRLGKTIPDKLLPPEMKSTQPVD
jgi:TRAP transporter TAXI family solute receptor